MRSKPDSPLPSWVENGISVFPESSAVSKNVYRIMGQSPHQTGAPIITVSYCDKSGRASRIAGRAFSLCSCLATSVSLL